jgi:hypothetical protein
VYIYIYTLARVHALHTGKRSINSDQELLQAGRSIPIERRHMGGNRTILGRMSRDSAAGAR